MDSSTEGRPLMQSIYASTCQGNMTHRGCDTYGCGATIACGSMLTEMIIGRSVEDCLKITQEQLIDALDGVPPDRMHSPALAIGALQAALGKLTAEAKG